MKKFIIFIALLFGIAVVILLSGFTLTTEYALVVLGTGVTLDFLTTWMCLKANGKEGNPAVAFLFRKIGITGTFGIMVVFWTIFVLARWIHQTEGIQTAVAIAYWLVPLNNIWVLRRLKTKEV